MSRKLSEEERSNITYLTGVLVAAMPAHLRGHAGAIASALVRIPRPQVTARDINRIVGRIGEHKDELKAIVRAEALTKVEAAEGEPEAFVLRVPSADVAAAPAEDAGEGRAATQEGESAKKTDAAEAPSEPKAAAKAPARDAESARPEGADAQPPADASPAGEGSDAASADAPDEASQKPTKKPARKRHVGDRGGMKAEAAKAAAAPRAADPAEPDAPAHADPAAAAPAPAAEKAPEQGSPAEPSKAAGSDDPAPEAPAAQAAGDPAPEPEAAAAPEPERRRRRTRRSRKKPASAQAPEGAAQQPAAADAPSASGPQPEAAQAPAQASDAAPAPEPAAEPAPAPAPQPASAPAPAPQPVAAPAGAAPDSEATDVAPEPTAPAPDPDAPASRGPRSRGSRRGGGRGRKSDAQGASSPNQKGEGKGLGEVPYVRRGGEAEAELRQRIVALDQRFWMNGWLLSHPGAFALYEKELVSLNEFLASGTLVGELTRRQLAYQMGGDEKFFEYGSDGFKLLRAMGVEDLIRHRPMPKPDLLYHAPRRRKHMRVLVTENLDPWLDVRDLMYEEGRSQILGERIHAVVLGGGMPVLEHNRLHLLLDTLGADSYEVLYWGDIDRAGFDIFLKLRALLDGKFEVKPFAPAYQLMCDRAMERFPDPADNEKTGQVNIEVGDASPILDALTPEAAAYSEAVIANCALVPQEILTKRDL